MKYIGKCCRCGAEMSIPDDLYAAAKHSERITFYCAYGHPQVFSQTETEETRLRRERDMLKQQNARLEEERREAMATANAQMERAKKAEAAANRLRKRASAGTCPCCSRTFSNMAEHMKHEHPEFVTETGARVIPIKAKRAS